MKLKKKVEETKYVCIDLNKINKYFCKFVSY